MRSWVAVWVRRVGGRGGRRVQGVDMAFGADIQCGAGMRERHTEKCTDFVVEKNIGRDLGNVCQCSGAHVSVSGNMCRQSLVQSLGVVFGAGVAAYQAWSSGTVIRCVCLPGMRCKDVGAGADGMGCSMRTFCHFTQGRCTACAFVENVWSAVRRIPLCQSIFGI